MGEPFRAKEKYRRADLEPRSDRSVGAPSEPNGGGRRCRGNSARARKIPGIRDEESKLCRRILDAVSEQRIAFELLPGEMQKNSRGLSVTAEGDVPRCKTVTIGNGDWRLARSPDVAPLLGGLASVERLFGQVSVVVISGQGGKMNLGLWDRGLCFPGRTSLGTFFFSFLFFSFLPWVVAEYRRGETEVCPRSASDSLGQLWRCHASVRLSVKMV